MGTIETMGQLQGLVVHDGRDDRVWSSQGSEKPGPSSQQVCNSRQPLPATGFSLHVGIDLENCFLRREGSDIFRTGSAFPAHVSRAGSSVLTCNGQLSLMLLTLRGIRMLLTGADGVREMSTLSHC